MVTLEASEALFVFTVEDRFVMLAARDEELFTIVVFVVVIVAANEELLVLILLCNPSILVAALELFVVRVLFTVVMVELREDEVLTNEELNVISCTAAEELNVVNAPRTSVMEAARDALSKEPVPDAAAAIVSILPAKDEDAFVNVVFTVLIVAAKEALFVFTALVRLLMDIAAEELFVVIVLLIFVMEELNDDDADR